MNIKNFRKAILCFIALAFVLASCTSDAKINTQTITPPITSLRTNIPTSTLSPTNTPTSTSSPTNTPTLTPTLTPTIALPVGLLTPVPFSNSRIIASNVSNLQEVARYYGQVPYIAKLTKNDGFLFILDPEGITRYDYKSGKVNFHFGLINSVADLQVSNDGKWALIDDKWLLDLSNDEQPNLITLDQKVELLRSYYRTFSLSPDGLRIALREVKCQDICVHKFQILNTRDFTVLHTQTGATQLTAFAFSPDGLYYALAHQIIEALSGGSTRIAGGVIEIFSAKDFQKVRSLNIGFPFYVSSIAFSEDSSLLAIAQTGSIQVFDVQSGDSKVSIKDLCESYYRTIRFAQGLPLRIVENSDCQSGIWTIDLNSETSEFLALESGTNFSSINFDEKGNLQTIPYPHTTRNWSTLTSIKFLTDNILTTTDCVFDLIGGNKTCSSRDRVILGTDEQFYLYKVDKNEVFFYSLKDLENNSNNVYYSLSLQSVPYGVYVYAFDPINKLIFYQVALSPNINRIIIQDMQNGKRIFDEQGETFIGSSVVFSEDKTFAAFCQVMGYNNRPNKDKLLIFNLTERKLIYKTNFTCGNTAISLSSDGSKIAIAYYYLRNPGDSLYSTRVLLQSSTAPYNKTYFDVEGNNHAVSFSPDDSLLAFACTEDSICFVNTEDNQEVYRLKSHPGISSLAFSKDGNKFAASFNWNLLSLYAIPPFHYEKSNFQSSEIPSFDVCVPGEQILTYGDDYSFEIDPIDNADFYLWGFFQGGKIIWEYQGTSPSSYKYTISATSAEHSTFSPGPLEIWVRGNIKGIWTDPPIILKACLARGSVSKPEPTINVTPVPTMVEINP